MEEMRQTTEALRVVAEQLRERAEAERRAEGEKLRQLEAHLHQLQQEMLKSLQEFRQAAAAEMERIGKRLSARALCWSRGIYSPHPRRRGTHAVSQSSACGAATGCQISAIADEVVCLEAPDYFYAVGQFLRIFHRSPMPRWWPICGIAVLSRRQRPKMHLYHIRGNSGGQ
jgi:hypothetical protein